MVTTFLTELIYGIFKVCRHKYFPQDSDRRRALSLLGKLAKSSGTFPQHYSLQGVKCHPEPVAGGSFSEVFRGEYEEKLISIKVIRAYQKQGIEESFKVNPLSMGFAVWLTQYTPSRITSRS